MLTVDSLVEKMEFSRALGLKRIKSLRDLELIKYTDIVSLPAPLKGVLSERQERSSFHLRWWWCWCYCQAQRVLFPAQGITASESAYLIGRSWY